MAFAGLCLLVKGDWQELVSRWGFPAWNDNLSPCIWCLCPKLHFFLTRGFSPMSMPYPEKTQQQYEDACRACEVDLVLTPAQIRTVRPALAFFSDNKARGRCLQRAVPELGLEAKDRLDLTVTHPDASDFMPEGGNRPTRFWRSSKETHARFRNPLLGRGTGVTIKSFVVDWMHCLSLGVFPHILGWFLVEILSLDVWNLKCGKALREEFGINVMKGLMADWFKKEESEGRVHSAPQGFTKGMLRSGKGSAGVPFLKMNAGECNGFLRFAAEVLLPVAEAKLKGRAAHYKTALATCIKMLDICWEHERRIPAQAIQDFCDACVLHMRALERLQISPRPKHHQAMELGARLSE